MTEELPEMSDDIELPPLPTLECPHCSQVVPAGHFCGSCGAHLLHEHAGRSAANRLHSYAAFPDEPMLRMSIVSSLFPHLSHRSRVVFRVASTWLGALLSVLAIAGLEAPLIAVAAVGIPILFQLYVIEVGPYGDDVVVPTFVTTLVGAAIGVGWAQIGGQYVQRNLLPVLSASLTDRSAFASAVVVPLVGQLLMCVPLVLLFVRYRVRASADNGEALNGYVVGAAGALGFTAASTIAELSSQFSQGIFSHQAFVDVLSQALIRGVSVPLVGAFATGIFGAALWLKRRDEGSSTEAGGRWLTSPLLALVLALVVQVGLGYTDIARLEQPVVAAVHLAAVVVMAVAARIGLHHVLLHEHHDFSIGPPVTCSHCHHLVPSMPFCPQCGVALHATARSHRAREAHVGTESVTPVTGAS